VKIKAMIHSTTAATFSWLCQAVAAKNDGKGDLDDDEHQLDPEGETKNAMLAVVNAQTLVFGAKKDCTEDVAAEE